MNKNTNGKNNCAIGYKTLYYNSGGSYNCASGYQSLHANTTGSYNCAYGNFALHYNTTGFANTAVGSGALTSNMSGGFNTALGNNALSSNMGSNNTAIGNSALQNNSLGNKNSAIGNNALHYNTTGNYNTATGTSALFRNTTASKNTATGYFSLFSNTTGETNSAFGTYALNSNTNGYSNTATGYNSLFSNIGGYENTALGFEAMKKNTYGDYNTAVGSKALANNKRDYNTAIGHLTLNSNTYGGSNTAIGSGAMRYLSVGAENVAIGVFSGITNITGSRNTSIGNSTNSTATNLNNTTKLGYYAITTASNQVRIGNSSVTSIGGKVSWSTLSDGRFKKDIKQDIVGLDFINSLKPVSYKVDIDAFDDFLRIPDSARTKDRKSLTIQTGFIAQEVEKAIEKVGFNTFNGIDIPKNENDYYSIRYAEFVVPLVKAVQELSVLDKTKSLQIESLEAKIDRLEIILIEAGLVTDINTAIQLNSKLVQNRPNPFSVSTEITCSIPNDAETAKLMVFDMSGSLIKTIPINDRGDCIVTINADELNGSGMYIYSLFVNNTEVSTKRMVLSE